MSWLPREWIGIIVVTNMSGTNPVDEMVELIAASRAYEANVRIIQQHDTATSELISRMLKV